MKQFVASVIHFTIVFISCSVTLFAQGKCVDVPMKGMSFLGPQQAPLNIEMFESLQTTNAEWIALVPEVILDRQTLSLLPDEENKQWGNTIEAQVEAIKLAKKTGLKIFLKPHVKLENNRNIGSLVKKWLFIEKDQTGDATWRGDFMAGNEKGWQVWESSYESYILKLAQIAESLDVELFCVGTELRETVIQRPEFWEKLIKKVRSEYTGSITYSANWDEFNVVRFWDKLDYIGVNAYFPISTSETPLIDDTINNWKPIKVQLLEIHKSEGKKILITEYGYRNVSFSGEFPWEHDKGRPPTNYAAQSNLYEAFYQSFWNESWMAGGFSWNWLHAKLPNNNTDFTIRNKPASAILKRWYSQDLKSELKE